MKKNILMLTCSLIVLSSTQSEALTVNEQLQKMKEVLIDTYEEMDTNRDDKLTKEEYLSYQFEKIRSSILEANSFDTKLDNTVFVNSNKTTNTDKKETINTNKNKETTQNQQKDSLKDGINIMKSMADFTLDEEELDLPPLEEDFTKELGELDDMPPLEDIDFKNLEAPIKEENKVSLAKEELKEELNKDEEIKVIMDMLKKGLPKKIDDITTWTDITYENKTLSYIYQADMDTSTFSNEEFTLLTNSIKEESCANAYKEMCPKIKPIFIDEGINMQISYIDKNKKELSSCEFNQETCK